MLTVIVGGFFGDEGKGKIAAYLAIADNCRYAVRTGSINAGHTVYFEGKAYKLRSIPSGFVNKSTELLIAPGALIRLDVLWNELKELNVKERTKIDYNAGIIEEKHIELEKRDSVLTSIGSTFQGVGAAMSDRVLRKLKLAKDTEELRGMLIDVSEKVNYAVDSGENVIIEGTQGTFLSLYHGTYPYVTSRDTTASGIISEVGIGPKKVGDVILVFKSFVTRVGEGPLENEMSKEEAEKLGLVEKGTVTGRMRRVAPFNVNLAKKAIMLNSATQIAITKIDWLFKEAYGVKEWSKLPPEARKWIESLEAELKVPITLVGTGEDTMQVVDRRKEVGL
ncbi:adenylosuccinate synthetase [Fervidicoccus fontis]|uniref:Adenylosuccinate synthetase n=1 Tax=Fervidicoccus fontis TaxID=683846 RepID=A0A7C2VI26_9CREN|nr:adenylosuccinate synthetase [Fervidicoccus fontis]PMB78148.1 MAG: adenylosuccinate synthetase [Fervidicoccus fontis]HEW64045.1 adenylosuccinate synthetase [Fervidicoccus fontis]